MKVAKSAGDKWQASIASHFFAMKNIGTDMGMLRLAENVESEETKDGKEAIQEEEAPQLSPDTIGEPLDMQVGSMQFNL